MPITAGSPKARNIIAAGLFAMNQQRKTNINRLAGPMPTTSNAESKLRNQSSTGYPIVRCRDLEKKAGQEVEFDLINPIGGKPIMGGAMAEGRGVTMSFSDDKLRINQTRFPIKAGDTMAQQRTDHDLRKLAKAGAKGYMDNLEDQLSMVHLNGSRGFRNTQEWNVPLASDPDFASICINEVSAPSRNRHFLVSGGSLKQVAAVGNEISIATTDTMNFTAVDSLRALVEEMTYAPTACKFEGDEMAADEPLRVFMVSPQGYASFVASGDFRTLQARAMQRSANAKNNPLFRGEAGLWNGILIVKNPWYARFYAGNPINYCASNTSSVETTTDLVPAAFAAAKYAVDRGLLLGSQALAQAFGKHRQSNAPYFWSEKWLDHEDKLEVLLAMIDGKSKIRFDVDFGPEGIQPTDNGVIAIDYAVKLQDGI